MPRPRAGLLVLHCCREWMMSSYLLIALRLLHVLLSLPSSVAKTMAHVADQLRSQNSLAKPLLPSTAQPAVHRCGMYWVYRVET